MKDETHASASDIIMRLSSALHTVSVKITFMFINNNINSNRLPQSKSAEVLVGADEKLQAEKEKHTETPTEW